ncbi:MAG: hypothetical protein LIP02_07920 [Bacteroidales bacterium]|nr:hypothetical protein [Bacteroidales bacterium]
MSKIRNTISNDTPKKPSTQPVLRARVTPRQKAEALAIAARCGLKEADYVRARCLGYEPRLRITEEQEQKLDTLSACRSDMVNFLHAMYKMTKAEKEQMFHHVPNMLQWMKAVNNIAQACKEFITEVQGRDCPPSNRGKKSEQQSSNTKSK